MNNYYNYCKGLKYSIKNDKGKDTVELSNQVSNNSNSTEESYFKSKAIQSNVENYLRNGIHNFGSTLCDTNDNYHSKNKDLNCFIKKDTSDLILKSYNPHEVQTNNFEFKNINFTIKDDDEFLKEIEVKILSNNSNPYNQTVKKKSFKLSNTPIDINDLVDYINSPEIKSNKKKKKTNNNNNSNLKINISNDEISNTVSKEKKTQTKKSKIKKKSSINVEDDKEIEEFAINLRKSTVHKSLIYKIQPNPIVMFK